MNNSKQLLLSCQQNSSKSLLKSLQIPLSRFEHFFRSLPVAYRKVMNYLLAMAEKNKHIFSSHQRIASYAGITRRHCLTIIHWLAHQGFISYIYRHRKTCIYYVSDIFSDAKVRTKLSSVFAVFGYLLIFEQIYAAAEARFREKQSHFTPFKRSEQEYNSPNRLTVLNRLNPGKSNSLVVRGTASDGPTGKIFNKKEKKMQASISREQEFVLAELIGGNRDIKYIPDHIESITELGLTVWGKIRLLAFSKEAIDFARIKSSAIKSLRDPFAYFMSQCLKHSEANKQIPNWQYVDAINDILGRPENAPMAISRTSDLKGASASPKIKTNYSPSARKPYDPAEHAGAKMDEKASKWLTRHGHGWRADTETNKTWWDNLPHERKKEELYKLFSPNSNED